ncbi:MAG: hypothetical protein PHR26_00190, partial [Candidatus ainarchaeum sp.]|nr:hypothetical protein [Candidatus ainarchaeum sp.]
MGLKQFYYKMEDKFYDFVEKHNLQKITDRIDKVMPSFVLFLIICVLLLTGLTYLVISLVSGSSTYVVYFKVVDGDSGMLLTDVPLQITTQDGINTYLTKNDGLTDQILVPKNTEIFVDVDFTNNGYSRFSESYLIDQQDQTITIALTYTNGNTENYITNYLFNLVDPNGTIIKSSGVVSFTCAGEGIAPRAINVYDGVVNVSADSLCNLKATVSIDGYQTKYDIPVVNGMNVNLFENEGSFSGTTSDITIYTKDLSGNSISNIKVVLKDDIGLIIDSCISGTGGSCTISDVQTGYYYYINITDNRINPIYGSIINEQIFLDSDLIKTYNLSSDVSGVIKIKVYDEDNQIMEDTLVSLKTEDSFLEEKYTDSSGLVTFNVSNLDLDYRAVVNVEGYFIVSKIVVPDEDPLNTTVQIIYLEKVTPNSIKPLNISVVDVSGNAYKFAKVVLFDANTGYMTDYSPKNTNYNGEAIFNVRSGDYFAVAVKGSSRAQSDVFTFDVRLAETYDPVVILMIPNKGYLNVKAVDKEENPIANVKVDVYDRFSYMNEDDELQVIKSELSDPNGEIFFEVDADSDYYVVISDPINDVYGKTQSRFVRVTPEVTKDLEVVLYNNVPASSKPEVIFHGLYKGDSVATGNLSTGEEYEAKFTLLMPNREDSDFEEYEEAGFIFRVGNTTYLENDPLYIKYIDVPNAESITKYTQYDNDQTTPYEVDGVYDVDTRTYEDAKWAKIVFSDNVSDEFYNAYEINAIVKVKDTAVVGQELKVDNLGYGLTDDGYETYSEYLGNQNNIAYFNVFNLETYGVGDEILCGDFFCYSSTIVDIEDDVRYNVTDSFSSMPNKNYKYHFML